ncbi:MAG: hypothetical protein M3014_12050, partial [Chloroflexota bacterium]|nr:hypothetical protein [Chloroflexota bacterium]
MKKDTGTRRHMFEAMVRAQANDKEQSGMKISSQANDPATHVRGKATLVISAGAVLSLFILVVMTLVGRASASSALAPVTSLWSPVSAPQSCAGPSFGSVINSSGGYANNAITLGYIDNNSYLDIAVAHDTGYG